MRNYFLFGILIFCSVSLFSQSVRNISVTGRVVDTLGETVPAATIMLLNQSDSTLVNYTTSDSDGRFMFKSVKNNGYMLKISHVSFMPLQKQIPVYGKSEYDFGNIIVEPIAEVLMEVVIKSAQAPLFIHGDTVEYDARLFKVPPGATVEDLLKRLPGIDVDADGNVSTMGKNVRRIYVDGKTFFGDDPKSVTKNLDAEAISRVQVYDDQSEQERLTGVDDGAEDEKVVNLELKEEYKKGYFGKATIAGGTDSRWAGRGNFNRFTEKQQFSFIGYANNINQTGVNWDDYSEFKGNSAYSGYDNGDFGFGGRNYHYFYGGGIINYFDGRGFTENYGGGANYNYFDDKVKFNASYLYNQTDLNFDEYSQRQVFLVDTAYYRFDTTMYNEFRNNHNVSARLEYEIDSSNTIIVKANSKFSGQNELDVEEQLFQNINYMDINLNVLNSLEEMDSYLTNILTIYNHKFKKKGRSFSISGASNMGNNKTLSNTRNNNNFYNSLNPIFEQLTLSNSFLDYMLLKSSVMYVEPITEKISFMGFYNFSSNNETSELITEDPVSSIMPIDSLSLFYTNGVIYNRIGGKLTYAYQGINFGLGGAYQTIGLSGDYSRFEGSGALVDPIRQTYSNFIPHFSASAQLPNKMRFSLNYSYDVEEPSIRYLQTVPIISNPLYIYQGNSELLPEKSHSVSGRMSYWNQASFTNFSISAYYDLYDSQIVYSQEVNFVEGLGYQTISTPENVEGGSNFRTHFWSSIPIVKTILSLKLGGGLSFREAPVYINGEKNLTNSNNYNVNASLNLTLGSKLSFSLGTSGSTNYIEYSIQTDQNQNVLRYGGNAGLKWQVAEKTFIEGNYVLTNYKNETFDFDNNVNLLNVSVRQLLGEKNKFEIRLAAFDLLNQKQYITQYAHQNYILTTSAPTLARYFMLSVSYNIKGFEAKIKKNRY